VTTHVFSSTGLSDAELKQAVGQRYHCGLSDGTRWYGYLFEPDNTKSGGFHWRTDTTTKEALTSYSSGQLIDRDLAFFPRITDGDFSGGGYQEVWIDPKKYFDSDLDPRVPGYLQLRSQWARAAPITTNMAVTANFEVVTFNGDFWYTFGQNSGNVYSANGGTTTVPAVAFIRCLDSDGTYLYAGTVAALYRSADGVAWTTVTTTINGGADKWWIVNQGTNGYFAYYSDINNPGTMHKIDLTLAFPIAAAAQPQVPTGTNAFQIVDLVEYQTSVAILTTDIRGSGFDVWYSDGTNLTRIVRVEGYFAAGMCNSLGSLYVSAYAMAQTTSPILAKIDSGTFEIVARPGSPFPAAAQTCGQPRASSQYVYWPLLTPSINGISSAPGVILQYDVLTGALSHLPAMDATDLTTVPAINLRTLAVLGDNLAVVFKNAVPYGILQYQFPAFGTIKYQTSGWLASSHIDFATPGIQKRFRRVEVHHSPLAAGEQILIEAFVDTDPLKFTTALTPVPATATATNTIAGSSLTALTFGVDTVGKTLYFAIKLTAGTTQLTTPRVSYISVEVGGTWVADINLACTSRRQNLGQEFDTQGATAADLAYLLYLAQENGNLLTFYHPNGQTYTMAIESLDGWNPTPLKSQENRPVDEEYVVHAILRQLATPAVG
jgi:hypothetical protein